MWHFLSRPRHATLPVSSHGPYHRHGHERETRPSGTTTSSSVSGVVGIEDDLKEEVEETQDPVHTSVETSSPEAEEV